jgi:hypothetical protein
MGPAVSNEKAASRTATNRKAFVPNASPPRRQSVRAPPA